MIRRALLLSAIILFSLASEGQIRIRIFARTKPITVVFTPVNGQYVLAGSTDDSLFINTFETVAIVRLDDKVAYRASSGFSGLADSVLIRPISPVSRYTLRAPAMDEDIRTLDGALIVKSFPGSLLVLDVTSLENYLPGVVRAEAGKYGPEEYFRAQAVVARTYIWRNIGRHQLDGFNLCDDTHCQVYPGIIPDSSIISACRSTEGKVIVDKDSVLIASAFHGNCGGVTASSADVWVTSYPYLVSITDPWCGYSESSSWKRSIPVSQFNDFLKTKGVDRGYAAVLFTPAGTRPERNPGFTISGKTISNEEIRQRFSLRSSFFTLTAAGDSIVVNGRGYGHGVGLCQDGAKAMAARNYSFDRITGFYYPGTRITDIKNAHWPDRP